MKRNCTSKSFKPITIFYCYKCHGFGHKKVDYKKPRFDSNNRNSRMFRDTNPIGNRRKRSCSNDIREGRLIFFYRCNNLRHIPRNCKTPDGQCDGEQRRNVSVCQLCNNFGHTTRFFRMEKRNLNRNHN